MSKDRIYNVETVGKMESSDVLNQDLDKMQAMLSFKEFVNFAKEQIDELLDVLEENLVDEAKDFLEEIDFARRTINDLRQKLEANSSNVDKSEDLETLSELEKFLEASDFWLNVYESIYYFLYHRVDAIEANNLVELVNFLFSENILSDLVVDRCIKIINKGNLSLLSDYERTNMLDLKVKLLELVLSFYEMDEILELISAEMVFLGRNVLMKNGLSLEKIVEILNKKEDGGRVLIVNPEIFARFVSAEDYIKQEKNYFDNENFLEDMERLIDGGVDVEEIIRNAPGEFGLMLADNFGGLLSLGISEPVMIERMAKEAEIILQKRDEDEINGHNLISKSEMSVLKENIVKFLPLWSAEVIIRNYHQLAEIVDKKVLKKILKKKL